MGYCGLYGCDFRIWTEIPGDLAESEISHIYTAVIVSIYFAKGGIRIYNLNSQYKERIRKKNDGLFLCDMVQIINLNIKIIYYIVKIKILHEHAQKNF